MRLLTSCRIRPGYDDYYVYRFFMSTYEWLTNVDDRAFIPLFSHNTFVKLAGHAGSYLFRRNYNIYLRNLLLFERPDVFFCFKSHFIDAETISIARTLGTRVVFFYPDVDPRIHGRSYVKALRQANCLLHTKPNLVAEFKSININSVLVPPVYSISSIAEILPYSENVGVLFVGHFSNQKYSLLSELSRLYKGQITIVGRGWENRNFSKLSQVNIYGEAYGETIQKMYQTCLLSISLLHGHVKGTRTQDIITTRSVNSVIKGAFSPHIFNDYISDHFSQIPYALFRNAQELHAIASHLLNNPMDRMLLQKTQLSYVLNTFPPIEKYLSSFINA